MNVFSVKEVSLRWMLRLSSLELHMQTVSVERSKRPSDLTLLSCKL
jgi:hypothetical protein